MSSDLNKLAASFQNTLKTCGFSTEDVATTVLTKEQRQLATDTLTNMRLTILNLMEKNPSQEIKSGLASLNAGVEKIFGIFIYKKPI
jgi:hypothetical protein